MWRAGGDFGAGEPFDRKRFLQRRGRSLWALGAPVIILGGNLCGVFSPTEAAAVACVYAGLVTHAHIPRAWVARHRPRRRSDRVVHRPDPIIVACARRVRLAADGDQVPAAITAWLQSLPRIGMDAAASPSNPAAAGRLLPRSAVGDPATQPAAVPMVKASAHTVHSASW